MTSKTIFGNGRKVRIILDGQTIEALAGETVAGTLLRNGIEGFSAHPVQPKTSEPFCMMGICHECAVEIDGKANRQACLTPVRDGMVISFSSKALFNGV